MSRVFQSSKYNSAIDSDQIPPDLMIANEPSNYLPLHTLCVEGVLISLQTFNATPYPIQYH